MNMKRFLFKAECCILHREL